MNKHIFSLVAFLVILTFPAPVLAHPGNTAGDGCHYCRTNCAKWGEVENARHCHGGGSSVGSTTTTQPATNVAPAATSNPTIAPTIKPTPKPTIVPSPSPTPSPSPSPSPTPSPTPAPTPMPTPNPSPLPSPTPENSPEVAGATDEVPEEPQARPLDDSSEGNPALGVGVLGATGAGAYMVFGKKRKVGEKASE